MNHHIRTPNHWFGIWFRHSKYNNKNLLMYHNVIAQILKNCMCLIDFKIFSSGTLSWSWAIPTYIDLTNIIYLSISSTLHDDDQGNRSLLKLGIYLTNIIDISISSVQNGVDQSNRSLSIVGIDLTNIIHISISSAQYDVDQGNRSFSKVGNPCVLHYSHLHCCW